MKKIQRTLAVRCSNVQMHVMLVFHISMLSAFDLSSCVHSIERVRAEIAKHLSLPASVYAANPAPSRLSLGFSEG